MESYFRYCDIRRGHLTDVGQKLSVLNEELNASDSTMSELERNLEQVKKESLRLNRLMEQSLYISESLRSASLTTDVKSLEREMWQLERECRLFPSSPNPPKTQPPPRVRPTTPDHSNDFLTVKEELLELKRQVGHITQSPLSPSPLSHPRGSTAQRDYHHCHNNTPEFSRKPSSNLPTMIQTPIHSKFFQGLPTPPTTASSTSSIASGHERFNSPLSKWTQLDESSLNLTPDLRRPARKAVVPSTIGTPTIKHSASHDSIFESASTQSYFQASSACQSSQSSLSSSVTPSPTYFSASACFGQNNKSSPLILSSTRGKKAAGLSSRKSFWNLWDKSSPKPPRETSSLRKVSPSPGLGRPVVCTEVDTEMLQDALEGLIYEQNK